MERCLLAEATRARLQGGQPEPVPARDATELIHVWLHLAHCHSQLSRAFGLSQSSVTPSRVRFRRNSPASCGAMSSALDRGGALTSACQLAKAVASAAERSPSVSFFQLSPLLLTVGLSASAQT
jgi:hypothetical protein